VFPEHAHGVLGLCQGWEQGVFSLDATVAGNHEPLAGDLLLQFPQAADRLAVGGETAAV